MPCRRCSGLMVVDHFMNLNGASGHMWVRGWRCVNCGATCNPLLRGRDMRAGRWISVMAGALLAFVDPRRSKPLH